MLTATLLAMVIAADTPPFGFTSKRDDDKVTAKAEEGRTLIDIHSPRGISSLVVRRTGEAWPERVVVRLHLRGLEQFDATSETVSYAGGVRSHTDYAVSLTVKGKKDDPKDPKSPYFLDFRMVGKDGKPARTIPLKDGYFEVKLPRAFFEGNPKSVTLSWVDFYRR